FSVSPGDFNDVINKSAVDVFEPVRHAARDNYHVTLRQMPFVSAFNRLSPRLVRTCCPWTDRSASGYEGSRTFKHVEYVRVAGMDFNFTRLLTAQPHDLEVGGGQERPALGNHRRHFIMIELNYAGTSRLICSNTHQNQEDY